MQDEKMLLYEHAAEFLNKRFRGITPFASVVLGSGLGSFEGTIDIIERIPFNIIPGFSQATAPDHAGELCLADIGGVFVLLQKGRFHYYEGYDPFEITFPIRTYKLMGIPRLILTNAAGGINRTFKIGDLMLIKDHIGLFAPSPLRGANIDDFGPRFSDMTYAYDLDALNIAYGAAIKSGIDIKVGIYAFTQGPMFETPAEINALSLLGADAVGMSTVPEVVTARHCGIKIAGISLISNMAAGITGKQLSHVDVIEASESAGDTFSKFMKVFLIDWHNKEE